jgi:hypothetical protein
MLRQLGHSLLGTLVGFGLLSNSIGRAEEPKSTGGDRGSVKLADAPTGSSTSLVDTGKGGDRLFAGCCDSNCEPRGTAWFDAEYLMWWMRGSSLPPLVTTSPAGTPRGQAGVLGNSATSILFGNSIVNGELRSGGRLTAGYWLDSDSSTAIEASVFALETKAARFAASSTGNPILARPFFNALTRAQDAELVAFPGVVTGSIGIGDGSRILGAGLLARQQVCCGCDYHIDALFGYRYLRYSDHLEISENLTSTDPNNVNIPPGTTLSVLDSFKTTNDFHGFDMGLSADVHRGPWTFGWLAKIGLGQNHESVHIQGGTTVRVPAAAPVVNSGGLYALSSNIGDFSHDRLSFVPELGLKVGYQFSPRVNVCAGYTLLLWDDVVQAGRQIDTVINSNLIPPVVSAGSNPARPAPRFESTNIWIQGIDFGVEFKF